MHVICFVYSLAGGALQVDGELAKLILEGDISFLQNYANCSGIGILMLNEPDKGKLVYTSL